MSICNMYVLFNGGNQQVCLKDAKNLLSLYFCALLRPKFNMTNPDIGINSSSH